MCRTVFLAVVHSACCSQAWAWLWAWAELWVPRCLLGLETLPQGPPPPPAVKAEVQGWAPDCLLLPGRCCPLMLSSFDLPPLPQMLSDPCPLAPSHRHSAALVPTPAHRCSGPHSPHLVMDTWWPIDSQWPQSPCLYPWTLGGSSSHPVYEYSVDLVLSPARGCSVALVVSPTSRSSGQGLGLSSIFFWAPEGSIAVTDSDLL